MASYQSMHPLRRSICRRRVERTAARDEAAQRKAARRACLFVAKLLAWCRTFLAAPCLLAALASACYHPHPHPHLLHHP
jgi:hypothetical protein